jgi:hypothetical protein
LPSGLQYKRGSQAALDDFTDDESAIVDVQIAKFSGAGAATLEARVRWWTLWARARGIAPLPLTLESLTTAFGSEVAANAVDAAGEWDITDAGANATLTYYDQSLSLVVAVTLTGMDLSTAAVVGGNLFITYAAT